MRFSIRIQAAMLLLAMGVTAYGPTAAADGKYPDKPLTILVGFSAGGGVDRVARVVAKYSEKYWGASAVVVDKPGAGGAIATNAMLRMPRDGYTISAMVVPNIVYQPAVRPDGSPGFKTDDLVQIGMVSRLPAAIFVSNSSRWKTLTDLIEDARRRPGKITLGVIGANTVTDGFRVQLEHVTQTWFQRVVFKGGAPLSKALIGGDVDVMVANAMFAVTNKSSMRPMAFASDQSFPLASDVPTFKSFGFDLVDNLWRGIAVARGTPEARVDHLREGLRAMTQDPRFIADMNHEGIFPEYLSAPGVQALIAQYQTGKGYVLSTLKRGK